MDIVVHYEGFDGRQEQCTKQKRSGVHWRLGWFAAEWTFVMKSELLLTCTISALICRSLANLAPSALHVALSPTRICKPPKGIPRSPLSQADYHSGETIFGYVCVLRLVIDMTVVKIGISTMDLTWTVARAPWYQQNTAPGKPAQLPIPSYPDSPCNHTLDRVSIALPLLSANSNQPIEQLVSVLNRCQLPCVARLVHNL